MLLQSQLKMCDKVLLILIGDMIDDTDTDITDRLNHCCLSVDGWAVGAVKTESASHTESMKDEPSDQASTSADCKLETDDPTLGLEGLRASSAVSAPAKAPVAKKGMPCIGE
jgi:hypothetical protein